MDSHTQVVRIGTGAGKVTTPVDEKNPFPVYMVGLENQGSVVADNGTSIPISSLAQTISYNPDRTLSHIEVTHDGAIYRQSMTWDAGNLVSVSAWEVQP